MPTFPKLHTHITWNSLLLDFKDRKNIAGKDSSSCCECSICHVWCYNLNPGKLLFHAVYIVLRIRTPSSTDGLQCVSMSHQAGYVGEDVESILYKLFVVRIILLFLFVSPQISSWGKKIRKILSYNRTSLCFCFISYLIHWFWISMENRLRTSIWMLLNKELCTLTKWIR